MRPLPELLAPAGSREALEAAIAAGADAVYLGGKRFGARKFSENFDDLALAEAVDYAHLRGVRVYVTVNTLVRENELHDVGEYLVRLYEIGADAVLLQDLGIALLASRIVPDLERHASTQMTLHNAPGLVWARNAGFKRAVLAREVSLNDIKEMNPQGIGIEVFVHGALCYSYSGQCLLSSAIGGRSGNRGMCAQPCRKPYVLLKGEKDQYGRPMGLAAQPLNEKFLISTRDLCTYRHLDRIVRSPVSSLKIEGRMKSPEYVAIVTSIYRKALDAIARGKWVPIEEDERDLALAFNRNFTKGHLFEATDVMGREASDNRGVLIGSVASFDASRGEVSVRLSGRMSPEKGDGLVFQAPGQEVGLVVQKSVNRDGTLRLMVPERIKPGAKVFLTGSTALAKKAQEIIASKRTEIVLDLSLTWAGGRPQAEARIPGGNSVCVTASFLMEKAKNRPLTRQQIESQLRRTGGTPFVVRRISMDYNEDLFAPLSALNQLRRDILKRAEEALLLNGRPSNEKVETARARLSKMTPSGCMPSSDSVSLASSSAAGRSLTLAVYADSLETVRGAVEAGCDRVYFEPDFSDHENRSDRMGWAEEQLEEAAAICTKVPLIWKWPRITRSSFFSFSCPLLAKSGLYGVMVENLGALQKAVEMKPHLRIYGGMGLNVCNHMAVQSLAPPLELLTLSPELSARQLNSTVAAARQLSNAPLMELVVQGSLEVMVAEDCVPCLAGGKPEKEKGSRDRKEFDRQAFWGLQDMRRIFPLRLDDDFRTHIFNSAETCLLDLMPEIISTGMDGIALDARGRTQEYARKMTETYKAAITLTETSSKNLRQELISLKEAIVPLTIGGITHGHFVKGLKDEIS